MNSEDCSVAGNRGPSVTGAQIGPYRIESPIGTGGMGVVYRAFDTKLNRKVAINFLTADIADPAARQRFQQEARAAYTDGAAFRLLPCLKCNARFRPRPADCCLLSCESVQ